MEGLARGAQHRPPITSGVRTPAQWLLLALEVFAVGCSGGGGGNGPAEPDPGEAPPGNGVLRVTTISSGVDVDPEGYAVVVDSGVRTEPIGTAATLDISGLPLRSHIVELSAVATNCDVERNPRQLNLTSRGVATTFDVTCGPASGDVIAFQKQVGVASYDVFLVTAEGTNPVNLTNHPAEDGHPAWSPDRTKIAFPTNRDGNFEIYVMNADGTGLVNLTNHPEPDGDPAWSPDGSKIAFLRSPDVGCEIYVMNADGTDQRNLTNDPGCDARPAWSPNGSKIAFHSNRDVCCEIFVMNPDGTGLVKLAAGLGPRWSPDGSQITFFLADARSVDVYVMDSDGSNRRRLTTEDSFDSDPTWSPDGSRIGFVSDRSARFVRRPGNAIQDVELYTMRSDGADVRRLTFAAGEDSRPEFKPR